MAADEQPYQVSKIDFSPIFISEFINSDIFKDSINITYKMIRKESGRIGNGSDESGSEFLQPVNKVISRASTVHLIYLRNDILHISWHVIQKSDIHAYLLLP